MIQTEEHELHKRRRGRNRAVGVVLLGFVALLFTVSIVKLGPNVKKPPMEMDDNLRGILTGQGTGGGATE